MNNAQIVANAIISDLDNMDSERRGCRMESGYAFCNLYVVSMRLKRAGYDTTEFDKFITRHHPVGGRAYRDRKLTASQIADVAILVNQAGYNVEAKKAGKYWKLLFV